MATYYVSPTGNDGAAGAIGTPWLTWHYAFSQVAAGDTLYLRGGTYLPAGVSSGGPTVGARINKTGTSGSPILISAYPGEYPVLDCTNITQAGWKVGFFLTNSSYINFLGLTTKNLYERGDTTQPGDGCVIDTCNHLNFARCDITRCGYGNRVNGSGNDYINWVNCDAWNNGDTEFGEVSSGGRGGYCDGFGIHTGSDTGAHFSFTGCRAWNNSDDGWDLINTGDYITFTNCWSFQNGKTSGDWTAVTGDGDGFKTGSLPGGGPMSGVRRLLTNCISAYNSLSGFDANAGSGDGLMNSSLYNCISYNNHTVEFHYTHSGSVATVKNCVASSIYNTRIYEGAGSNVENHNSWDGGITVSDADFQSVDWTQMMGARKSDGSLPDITFLHLITGSDLIHKGTPITGLTLDCAGNLYDPINPSIGPFELFSGYVMECVVYTVQANPPLTSPINLTFRNNSITLGDEANYWLLAGDEAPGGNNRHLDGAIITGNKLIWTGSTDTGQHGIFLGYNINQVVKYNYLEKVPYGVVYKSGVYGTTNLNNISGGFAYNIVRNSDIGVRIKGINGVCVYNNTFYDDIHSSSPSLIDITAHTDSGAGQACTNIKIKNNIFYTTQELSMIRLDDSSTVGFESDYNIFYCAAGSSHVIFTYNGVTKTFAQWQALGYDTHSVILNPNFINTTALVPTVRLDYGTNLGATWQAGLSTSAVWTLCSTPAITNQNGAWQVGARVYSNTTAILVTSVVVSAVGGATTITTNGGTLQMQAAILPVDATDKTVTWSVINGTGTASISATGLLTALTNGNITVKATSNG